MRKIIHTFRTAFKDARKNLLHTLLSVLGIVIGVGALVSILSLIDGMEKFAHEQISKTTSLESIIVNTRTQDRVDNIWVAKEEYGYFTYELFDRFLKKENTVKGHLIYTESGFISVNDSTERGILLRGIIDTWSDQLTQISGRFIEQTDLDEQLKHVVLSKEFAEAIGPDKDSIQWLGEVVEFKKQKYTVVGIIDGPSSHLEMFVPITLFPQESIRERPPNVILMANSIEEVPKVKENIESYINEEFGDQAKDFSVVTNEFRVDQANKGFLVFRLIMGMIVGISVLVGGIGVMNVLLISVTERTAEIGVRKAVGAKRRDIVTQFLSESLSISFIGSLLGVILGILFTLVAVPIVKHLTEMPFSAAYTLDTLFVIVVVSIVVGVVFGTYPALKASKLDPVEAIRRE